MDLLRRQGSAKKSFLGREVRRVSTKRYDGIIQDQTYFSHWLTPPPKNKRKKSPLAIGGTVSSSLHPFRHLQSLLGRLIVVLVDAEYPGILQWKQRENALVAGKKYGEIDRRNYAYPSVSWQ